MEGVCTGACIFGKCPNKICVRHNQRKGEAVALDVGSRILEDVTKHNINSDKTGLGFAVDIGTTTVVTYLYELENARLLSVKSALNSQITLGVDVISRIKYCETETDGLGIMNRAITKQLNSLFEKCLGETGLKPDEISNVVITGNTTMQHLAAGLSPVAMGRIPFEPMSLFDYSVIGKEIGLITEKAEVYFTPCISAFVGGDIASAIIASEMTSSKEISLLMDLGTNGELALGNSEKMFTTSTAAGPAFEGAEIERGMAGVDGAVCSVYPIEGKIGFDVIGDKEPQGLCGSGILDLVSLCVKAGVIDEAGYIVDSDDAPETLQEYIKEKDGNNLIWLTKNVYLTQKDIRKIQTAKAAVAAGVKCLLHDALIVAADIKNVYIAGGFGNFMNQESAFGIGLLDESLCGKTKSIGNAAGTGATKMLLNNKERKEAKRVAEMSDHVELGGSSYFMDAYVECMSF